MLVAAALGLGGTAAVYAGMLLGPVHAHHAIGAPPHRADRVKPHPGRSGTGQPGSQLRLDQGGTFTARVG